MTSHLCQSALQELIQFLLLKMDLYCCWFSHLPADLYKILMFSRHIFSYIALLLNDWLSTMLTICSFSSLECNNPLIITHCCSNELISNIYFRTLIKSLDFYIVLPRQFCLLFESIDTISRWSKCVWSWCGCFVFLYHQSRKNWDYFSLEFKITVNHHYCWHQYYHDG